MGFDNECIINIQSLAGEYFCPVCRLLVYPNEALQSQCTHLYCKPCLTYVVSTTRACPYDGYLVTEADSKPLTETNKQLVEIIGKIPVHCLYHKSGCTWQGLLSACTSHCSSCAFGNSPVVCNRCGIQIVHRQVQEHAQSCPGVPPQAQAGVAAATPATVDRTQSVVQAPAVASQAQPSQAAGVVLGKEANQQLVLSSQAQAAAQTAVSTAEQWYQQQQQQYQQYYQQYPGYDQHQQHYYAYQQQYVTASASNAIGQSQAQPLASPHLQAPVANQPQNQAHQVHAVITQQTYPPAHGHPQSQTHPQPQGQQLYTQYQQAHPLPQIQKQIQTQSQTQNTTPPAVTGHVSYSQPNGELQMHAGAQQQYHVHSQSQLASKPQILSPVQALNQFPQQPQQLHLHQSPATILSQQQQVLLPPSGQLRNIPPAQQPVQEGYLKQPRQPVHQRPALHAFSQHQRPQGQPHLFPLLSHANQQLPQNVASSHATQHVNSQNHVGRPSMPSHGVQSRLYLQHVGGLSSRPMYPGLIQQSTNQDNFLKQSNQFQLPSGQHSAVNAKPTISAKADSDPKSVVLPNPSAEIQTVNSGSDMKPVGSENELPNEGKPDLASSAAKESIHVQKGENGEPLVKEVGVESMLNHSNIGESSEVVIDTKVDVLKEGFEKIKHSTTTIDDKKIANGSQQEIPPGQGEKFVKDAICGSDNGSQEVSISLSQVQDGFSQPPYPTLDQGKHQPLPSHYGPTTGPHRPAATPLEPPQHKTPPLSHFGPQVPGQPSGTSFVRGPTQYGPEQKGSEVQSVTPHGTYNSMHPGAIRPLVSGALPPPSCDLHGGMLARPTTHGPVMFPNQRPNFMDGRQPDPNFPGSLEHGKLVPNMKNMNSFDNGSPMVLRDERLRLHAERFNIYPTGRNHRMPDRAEFFDDMKQIPRPFGREPRGFRYDSGLKIESGVVSSRFLSPYDSGSSNYSGERSGIRHEDPFRRMEPNPDHPDFFGPAPSFSRQHMDSFATRSPGREHFGMSSHGFRGPVSDAIHSRNLQQFGEQFLGPFPESKFSMLPSHLRRGEFEGGPGRMGVGDRLRSGFIGHDGFSSHLRWREHIGNIIGDLQSKEPVGIGAHLHQARMTEIGGPRMDSFGGPSYPLLGEPGFRSIVPLRGLSNDSGSITGELGLDTSGRRKLPTMGWCRICKVDCETVEGLDLHSQTREHQKMAMDIVVTIKQNAKRKKLASGDQSSHRDASKSRNTGSEDCGRKL